MENSDIQKRGAELSSRSLHRGIVTHTGFLTPAQQYDLASVKFVNLLFFGGKEECERKIAFFLPDYLSDESFSAGEYITAVHAETKFAKPGHRDYLGAIMSLGIARESIGDIFISGCEAWFFLTPGIADHVLLCLTKIGRSGVSLEKVPLSEVPVPERKMRHIRFTVNSLRLDKVVAEMFGISRADAVVFINSGLVSLNYTVCQRTDTPINTGDIISIRGKGKGVLSKTGGESRKGRLIAEADIYL